MSEKLYAIANEIKVYYVHGYYGSYLEYAATMTDGSSISGYIDTVDGDSDGDFLNNDIDAIIGLVTNHPRGLWADIGVNSLEDFSEHVGERVVDLL